MPGRRPGERFDALRAAAARTANEELARGAEREGDVVAHLQEARPFRCECGREGCTEVLEVSVAQYRAALKSRARIAARDHPAPEDEVVERHERHVVVR